MSTLYQGTRHRIPPTLCNSIITALPIPHMDRIIVNPNTAVTLLFCTSRTLLCAQAFSYYHLGSFHSLTPPHDLVMTSCNTNSELRTPVLFLGQIPVLLQDSIPSPPFVQPCTSHFRSLDPTLFSWYVFPFTFPFRALLSYYLTCYSLLSHQWCLFPHLTHLRYFQTYVWSLQTFLIHPQYLLDLESPLFSFHTDFELYK